MYNKLLFLIIILVTNTIQTITGFAGTLLAMPPAILLIGIDDARAILNLLTWIACLIISLQNMKYFNKKEWLKMIAFMFIGILMGIGLYDLLPLNILLTGYGILIVLIALKGLFIKKTVSLPKIALILIIIGAGIIHGMFVTGGALLVVYAAVALKDKNEFRATIAPVWVALNTFMGISHYQSGYLTQDVLLLTAIAVVPLLLGIKLGNKLYDKIEQAIFMKITYVLLGISGLMILV
jgi:uncharacterized membrane protein YfcA